jgi:hypothetical protein
MKLTNKIALISTLGCLALVGTGFAAYIYTTGADSKSTDALSVIAVAEKSEIKGEITLAGASSVKLSFDSQKKADGTQYLDSNGHLVSEAKWGTDSITATWNSKDGVDQTTSKHWTVSVTRPASSLEYFTLPTTTFDWVSGTAITLPAITVNHTNDPQTPAAYTTMQTALLATTITFTFTVA